MNKGKYFVSEYSLLKATKANKEDVYEVMIKNDLAKIVPGLGDNGVAVELEGGEAKRAEEVMKKEAFNVVASNKISYNRTIVDARHPL